MHGAHILIVEDDPIIGELFSHWFQRLGGEATLVDGTIRADAALATGTFDLIISDVHLPGNHGLRWIETVLNRPQPPPVILITGNPELATTLRAANLPVAGYLVKPPDIPSLTKLAHCVIETHRLRRELRTFAEEVVHLLGQPGSVAEPARDTLSRLARQLTAEAARNPRESAGPAVPAGWQDAITDTIRTLEKTRHSFRSKDLGELRQRLQRFLDTGTATMRGSRPVRGTRTAPSLSPSTAAASLPSPASNTA